jgi:hypothetical protein
MLAAQSVPAFLLVSYLIAHVTSPQDAFLRKEQIANSCMILFMHTRSKYDVSKNYVTFQGTVEDTWNLLYRLDINRRTLVYPGF